MNTESHPPSCFCKDCRGDSGSESNVSIAAENNVQTDSLSEWHEIVCSQIEKMIWQLTNTVRKANRIKGKETMAQFQTGNENNNTENNQRGRQNYKRNGIQNLGSQHLSDTPKKAKIIAARIPEQWYSLQLKILVNGNLYFWNLKAKNPNLAAIAEHFGTDTDNLVGKEFMLANQIDEWSGNSFPTFIEPVTQTTTKTKK